ncbi:RNA pyrophosphohydrolase [Helicobacter monodelphidis]|uniref:RNA pyrophosphohydrolase n=1 Tax=Helicobacter sp. 15-1451 TaxID=2004995 RepID=UPI000DCC61F3|nr:RNA pyrophosphohydrolase [Helicobacter sp. 15-1451]RAX57813.1 RNA pyrophosphohydrolase [Helicobacter sp. 15-1451]
MEQNEKKIYRPNVAAVIVSPAYPEKCEFFIASRTDIKDAWQFPQGGIDEGESPKEALFRELKEEIGTDRVDLIAEYPQWVTYDFPPSVAQKMYPFSGQRQKYFLVRLHSTSLINIQTEVPEFNAYKFVPYKIVFNEVTNFKRMIYKHVLDYFKRGGYL